MFVDWFGYVAAALTSLSLMPQAIKVIKTKDTKSLSLTMYSMFTFGVGLWLVYGLLKTDIPIILANIITLIFALSILAIKIKNRAEDRVLLKSAS